MVTKWSESATSILVASRDLAATSGLGDIRVDQVARQAGVNKRMIYHHFGNKTGLLEALVDWQCAVLMTHVSNVTMSQTERLIGRSAVPASVPEFGSTTVSGHELQAAAKIVMQHLLTAEVPSTPPDAVRDWQQFCIEVLSYAVFGESGRSLTNIPAIPDMPSEPPSKPRIRLSAAARQAGGGDGTSRS